MITFKKKENKQLSPHFNSKEFECPCNACDNSNQYISQELIDELEVVRQSYGDSVVIESGYRCPSHNKAVGGKENSAHLAGLAADIRPKLLIIDELDKLYDLCYNNFSNIGDGRRKKFIHVDVRPAKPTGKRKWIY